MKLSKGYGIQNSQLIDLPINSDPSVGLEFVVIDDRAIPVQIAYIEGEDGQYIKYDEDAIIVRATRKGLILHISSVIINPFDNSTNSAPARLSKHEIVVNKYLYYTFLVSGLLGLINTFMRIIIHLIGN